MTHKVTGVVDNSYSKDKVSKAGKPFKVWYFDVDGVTVSTGFNKKYDVGEMVDCMVAVKYGEWQWQAEGGGPNLPAATPQVPGKAPAGGGFKKGGGRNMGSFPIDPKDGQISIIRQSSMDRAVDIVSQLMMEELFKPATEEEYMKKLFEIALEVTDYASGNDITKLMKAQQAAMKAVQ